MSQTDGLWQSSRPLFEPVLLEHLTSATFTAEGGKVSVFGTGFIVEPAEGSAVVCDSLVQAVRVVKEGAK